MFENFFDQIRYADELGFENIRNNEKIKGMMKTFMEKVSLSLA